MQALLNNDRVRILVLNSTLVLLFIAAWVSDKWPDYSFVAILLALALVIAEAAVFKIAASHGKNGNALVEQPAREVVRPSLGVSRASLGDVADFYENILMEATRTRVYALRPRASSVASWSLASVREDRLLFLALTRDIERRRPLSFESGKWKHNAELEKWKLVRHSDEAFNIKAGAFEIEYFHGKTNIRVLDSSRVTVEGENRGEKLQAGLVGVLPAAYH